METTRSSTTTEAAERTNTLALLAILEHAADHGLQVTGIDAVDRFVHHVPRVRVAPEHLRPWLDTLVDVSDPKIRAIGKGRFTTLVYLARLATAVGDLQFEVSTTRPSVLALVNGGVR